MKRKILIIINIVLLGTLFINPINVLADKPDFPGVWTIWGQGVPRDENRPWLKGAVIASQWIKIEPNNNQFDFTDLDWRIQQAANNNLYIIFKIYIHGGSPTNNAPLWLYDNGVPSVVAGSITYPYYLDEDFRFYMKRMIRKVAEHVDTYPLEIRSKIIGVQCPLAVSGDQQPYYSAPNAGYEQYAIDQKGTAWNDYKHEMMLTYRDAFKDKNLPLLFNLAGSSEAQWLNDNIGNYWRKASHQGQMYQLNKEMDGIWNWGPSREFQGNWSVRTRAEYTAGIHSHYPWFEEAPKWNVYWQVLWSLTYGLDIFNSYTDTISNSTYAPYFSFFSKYAGYEDPRDSLGAWIAFRDGLDYNNKERFPESFYGNFSGWDGGRNLNRYLNITEAFSGYGAVQGYPEILSDSFAFVNNGQALNDVGFNIWQDNYGMYINQIDALETSQGYWRVGSKDEPYGRFARGFNHTQGKDVIYLNIDDGFFFNQPLNGQYDVKVRVVYFDEGTGSWRLRYDAEGNANKVAYTQTKTNTNTWKEKIITISDAYFGNRGARGSDIILENADTDDDKFHMVEVTRETGDRKCFWGNGVYPDPNCDDTPIPQVNLLQNPSFESDEANWSFHNDASSDPNDFSIITPGNGSNKAAKITLPSISSNMQLFQKDITLKPNTNYKLSFDAYSNSGNNISLFLHKDTSPYTDYGISNQTIDLTQSWQNHSIVFTTKNFSSQVSDARLRIWFTNNAQTNDNYYFDNFVLEENNGIGVPSVPSGLSVE